MTALRFANAVRVSPSPNAGMANLELLDGSGATIAAAQLNAEIGSILLVDLCEALGLHIEPAE